jgi:hypothetical protein
LPPLAILGVGGVLVAIVLPTDAGPRTLKLVIDPAMSAADAATAWSTNIGPDARFTKSLAVHVQRPDASTVHVTLAPTPAWNQRIDFWIMRSAEGLRVEGTSVSIAAGNSATWPVRGLVGTVRLSRSDFDPTSTEPLYLAFDLNGHSAWSDAPHSGLYEIPASLLR